MNQTNQDRSKHTDCLNTKKNRIIKKNITATSAETLQENNARTMKMRKKKKGKEHLKSNGSCVESQKSMKRRK